MDTHPWGYAPFAPHPQNHPQPQPQPQDIYPPAHYPFRMWNTSVAQLPRPIVHPPPDPGLATNLAPEPESYDDEEELDQPAPLPQLALARNGRTRKPPARLQPQPVAPPSRNRGKAKGRSRAASDAGSLGIEDEGSTITAIFLPDPAHPPIQLRGVNKNGLLPAPPGVKLDVNDLLILHPANKGETVIPGHSSQYEMYTCRVCSKTYDGKNARSVARRHLQDKHGVPLSVQKRRSRWDLEPHRPSSQREATERNLKSKRNWAVKNRQQGKLEKSHSAFLERFGPDGVVTACGMRLIAPRFRGGGAAAAPGRFLDGAHGKVIIPEEILRGVQAIRKWDGEGSLDIQSAGEDAEVKYKAQGGKKAATVSGPAVPPVIVPSSASSHSSPTSTVSSPPDHYQASITHTPVSTARTQVQEPTFTYQPCYLPPPTLVEMSDGTYQYQYVYAQYDQMPLQVDQELDTPPEVEQFHPVPLVPSYASTPQVEVAEAAPIQQQWVASSPWQMQQPQLQLQQLKLEPAHEIEPQWHRTHLAEWESDESAEHNEKEGSVETEGEAVAAESLLDLHSTPIRGPGETPASKLAVTVDNTDMTEDAAPSLGPEPAHQWPLNTNSSLLQAPSMASPIRRGRTQSFIQPFRDPRPEITRSLSFDHSNGLDDPFALNPTPARLTGPTGTSGTKTIGTIGRRKRHTISAPSPSPLSTSRKKRKEAPSSPMAAPAAPSAPRSALRTISNTASQRNVNTNTNAVTTMGFGAYSTPLKGAATTFPTSVTRSWLLSSPANADTAASLGLVPTHLAPTTPGLRGIVGADTPEMTILEARAKAKKAR